MSPRLQHIVKIGWASLLPLPIDLSKIGVGHRSEGRPGTSTRDPVSGVVHDTTVVRQVGLVLRVWACGWSRGPVWMGEWVTVRLAVPQ